MGFFSETEARVKTILDAYSDLAALSPNIQLYPETQSESDRLNTSSSFGIYILCVGGKSLDENETSSFYGSTHNFEIEVSISIIGNKRNGDTGIHNAADLIIQALIGEDSVSFQGPFRVIEHVVKSVERGQFEATLTVAFACTLSRFEQAEVGTIITETNTIQTLQ